MLIHKSVIIYVILLLSLYSYTTSSSSEGSYSNLTHTCRQVEVCVQLVVLNTSCVDLKCLINSGGNQSQCSRSITSLNLTTTGASGNSSNTTSSNNITSTCNGTRIYPTNTSLTNTSQHCLNSTSWDYPAVCAKDNVACPGNSTPQCSLNPVFYIGGFFNLKHSDGWGNLPAAELAIREVNKDKTNLTGTTLHLVAEESTQGLLSHGTELLYTYLNSGPSKIMLLLPQENDLARTVSAYAGLKEWGTLQFSYGTTDYDLSSNKKLFPRFFRLNPLTISYNRVRAAFVKSFPKWKDDIALLYYADTYYEEVNSDLYQRLKDKGLKVVANVGFRSSPEEVLDILKAKDAHVILTSFPTKFAKKLFCKAYKLGMFGPHYVWVTFHLMYYKFWIPQPADNLDCSEFEMTCATENHFSFSGASLGTGNIIGSENITFSDTYNELVNSTKNRTSTAGYAYDAVWTIANILKRARKTVNANGKRLSELTYKDINETKLFEELAYSTDFMGTTGRIRFYNDGNRKFDMNVWQVRPNGYGYYVGKYDVDNDVYEASGIKWQGGLPYERTTKTYQWRNIDHVLFVLWCIFATLGILFALFCFGFVIKYRRDRCIKYSSPTINLCIILGCLLNFISVILYGVDYQKTSESRMTDLCRVRLWLLSLGFSLCIGGLWVKVWTLYQILIERRVNRKKVLEYWMTGVVLVFLLVDIVYLAIWTGTDGLYRTVETVNDQAVYDCSQPISGNPFRLTTTYVEICDCDNMAAWLGIFLAYKAVVLLYGLHMAWKVRAVYTRKLIDAQYCAVLIIIAVLFCFFGLIFALALRLYPSPHYGLLGIIIIIYSFIVLITLFAHKITIILHRPVTIVHSKTGTKRHGWTGSLNGLCSCVSPLSACWSAFTAVFCCCCCCCKGLRDGLLRGPKHSRDSFVKNNANDKMDYQIGSMPGDREKQVIILRKQLEKKEKYLSQLKGLHRSTHVAKHTQTTSSHVYTNSGQGGSSSSERSFEDENDTRQHRYGKARPNRFKIYHRKLDFSHVSSKVDSRLDLDGKSPKREGLAETPETYRYQDSPHSSAGSEVRALQRSLYEREKELKDLKAYLGIFESSTFEPSSKGGSLENIGEESSSGPEARDDASGNNSSINGNKPLMSNSRQTESSLGSPSSGSTNRGFQKDSSAYSSSAENASESSPGRSYLDLDNNRSVAISISAVDLQPTMVVSDDEHHDHKDVTDTQPEQRLNKKVGQASWNNEAATSTRHGKGTQLKVFNSPNDTASEVQLARLQSSPYLSVVAAGNGRTNTGRFRKKIRQLRSFGLFKVKSGSNSNTTIKVKPFENGSSDQNNGAQIQVKINGQSLESTGNTQIPNTHNPDYSNTIGHSVKDGHSIGNGSGDGNYAASQLTNGQKPISVESEVEKGNNNNSSHSRSRSTNVRIINAPSKYSHVRSRLFAPSAASSINTTSTLTPTPTPTLTPTPARRTKEDKVKSTEPIQENLARDRGGKENKPYLAKSRSNVRIFNAPADYSHVKARVFKANNEPEGQQKFRQKVNQMRSFGVMKHDS